MSGTALDTREAAALAEHEAAVERGLGTFLDVGRALMAIRDDRLYRAEHRTFDAYCRSRWKLSPSRAYQFIDAAHVSTVVDVANEAQARELAPLLDEPEALRDAWQQASDATGGKPTAAAIRNVVRPPISPPSVVSTPPGGGEPVRVTHTTKTTEEFLADRETGEVTAPPPLPAPVNPVAAARDLVAKQPAMVAGKGIERLRLARETFEAAGTATEVVDDLANDELVDRSGDWLEELDRAAAVIAELTAALRRRNLRSVKP